MNEKKFFLVCYKKLQKADILSILKALWMILYIFRIFIEGNFLEHSKVRIFCSLNLPLKVLNRDFLIQLFIKETKFELKFNNSSNFYYKDNNFFFSKPFKKPLYWKFQKFFFCLVFPGRSASVSHHENTNSLFIISFLFIILLWRKIL